VNKVRCATACVAFLHLALLCAMLPDYFADNDLGYHISLSRQYGIHGQNWWDNLNWAPSGRPNLQGPALHYAIGFTGRLLGGQGDDYVHAFSIWAVLQWAAAAFTAFWFARRYGGDWAALIAVALLTGSAYSAAPFFVGVPSGWIFILAPWAIHFFLSERPWLSIPFATMLVYVHLGGAPVAGFGILLAALATRRWKWLLICGASILALSSPYMIHFLRHLSWYNGRRGHVAGDYAWLIYLLAVPAYFWLARRPKENLFLLIWPWAAFVWIFQDGLRFMLQTTVAASAIAGIGLARICQRWENRAAFVWGVTLLVILATVMPLSIPAVVIEWSWATGRGFPRELDWNEARTLARVVDGAKLNSRIVNSYYDSLSAAMAVYTDLRQEYGHWGEVKPVQNPAAAIQASDKVYVVPVPPGDPVALDLQQRGYLQIHGGAKETSIVTITAGHPLAEAVETVIPVMRDNMNWLADHAVNNRFPSMEVILSPKALADRTVLMMLQRKCAGRIELAVLIYSQAVHPAHPNVARGARGSARGWGSVANFLGDETALDYLGDARFERFRHNAKALANALPAIGQSQVPTPEIDQLSSRLFKEFF